MATPARSLLQSTVAGVVVLGGCADAAHLDATQAERRFESALADRDGAAACRLLSAPARAELTASGHPCAVAVVERLRPGNSQPDVEVYGDQALARRGSRAVFLTRYAEGWLVSSAGCTRGPHDLYDCAVQGG